MIIRFGAIAALLLLSYCCFAAALETNEFSVKTDSQGRLISLLNKISGKEYYHGRGTQPVRIYSIGNPMPSEIPLVCSSIRETGNSIICTYEGQGAEVTLTISPDASRPGILLWNTELVNKGSLRITEVKCPCLTELRIGKSSSDDTLVRPNRYGEKIPDPVNNLFHKAGEIVNGNKYEDWWNCPRLEYSGQAGMFWMDMYDKDSGLYIASEDKELIGGYLYSDVEGGKINLNLGKYTDVKNGQSISLLFSTGIHTGDWHWGADTYRKWAYSFMEQPSVPRWAREMPNWYWYSSIWSMGPDKPKMQAGFDFNNIKSDMYEKALSLGTGVIGLSGLEFMGHDYPLWDPDFLVGNDETIISAVRNVHRRGGRIVPYINPIYAWEDYPNVPHSDDEQFQYRLKRLSSDILQPNWDYYKAFTAKRYDNTHNNVEVHYHGNLPQMCLATREWQDYVLWWTERYANYYGFDGVQWDQLGAYQNTFCLDESHGHKVSGCATEGISELCRRIFNDPEYKAHDDFYIWYEGCCDIYGQYLHAGHAGFELWMAYGYPELIQYTFGHNFLGGEYNQLPDMGKEGLIRAQRCVEKSFLGRYKLGTGQNTQKAYKIEKLAPLTNMLKGLYWYTDYCGNEAVTVPEGMEASLLKLRPEICPYTDTRGYIVPVCDMRKEKSACSISFEAEAPVSQALWYPAGMNPQPQPVPFSQQKGRITVKLPKNTGMNAFNYGQAYCKEDNTVSSLGLIVLTEKPTAQLALVMPQTAQRGSQITVKTVTVEGREPVAEGTLSAKAGNYHYLCPVAPDDGSTVLTQKAGRSCYEIKNDDKPYLYIQVLSEALRAPGPVSFEIEYLDTPGTFTLQYSSTDCFASPFEFGNFNKNYKPTDTQFKGNSGKWKKAVFTVNDSSFSNAMSSGADFRLYSSSGTLYVASIRVIKEKLLTSPAPQIKVRMGNEEIITDKNGEALYTFRPEDPEGFYRIEAYQDKALGLLPTEKILEVR